VNKVIEIALMALAVAVGVKLAEILPSFRRA